MAVATVNWPVIQEALRVWVRDSMELPDGRVIWGWPGHPQPARPYAWLQIITGLMHVGAPQSGRTAQAMRDRITVQSAAAGPYTLRVYEATPADTEGVAYTHVAAPGDTVEQIRDAWAAEIAASGLTVTTAEDDAIVLDGTAQRPAWHAVVEAGAAELVTELDALVEGLLSVDRFTLRVYVDADMAPGEPALDLMSRAALALRLVSTRRALNAIGVARYATMQPQNLTFFSGDKFVARAGQDFQFNVVSRLASEQTPWIRTAETQGSVVGGGPA